MAGYIGNKAVNLSTSGADISGTANLDTVDIDGAVDFASTTAHAGNASFADNAKAIFGAGSDLQIYHSGTHSFIDDAGQGNLYVRGNSIQIGKYTGEIGLKVQADDAVTLYYDNSQKLATTSTGVDITGTLTSDGLTSAGNVLVSQSGSNSSITINRTDEAPQYNLTMGQSGVNPYITGNDAQVFHINVDPDNTQSSSAFNLNIDGNIALKANNSGDISFYEDTGTTAKFFWDASAESLGIGVSTSSNAVGDLVVGTSTGGTITLTRESESYAQNDLIGRIDWFNEDNSGEGQNVAAYIGAYASGSNGDDAYLTFNTVAAATGGADAGEAMRIDSSGQLLLGTPTVVDNGGYNALHILGNTSAAKWCMITKSYNRGRVHFHTANGGISDYFVCNGNNVGQISQSASGTSYSTSSDYRLKTDAQPMTGASSRVQALNPVNFEWIADGTRVDGFLAHEAQAVVPEAVTGTKDGMMDEEYQVSAATGDIYTPATDAYVDEDGNDVDAVNEVIHSANVEQPETLEDGQQWRETTPAVMGTRSVPDMQGIDQSKMVPLLVASLQEALARITALENT